MPSILRVFDDDSRMRDSVNVWPARAMTSWERATLSADAMVGYAGEGTMRRRPLVIEEEDREEGFNNGGDEVELERSDRGRDCGDSEGEGSIDWTLKRGVGLVEAFGEDLGLGVRGVICLGEGVG